MHAYINTPILAYIQPHMAPIHAQAHTQPAAPICTDAHKTRLSQNVTAAAQCENRKRVPSIYPPSYHSTIFARYV